MATPQLKLDNVNKIEVMKKLLIFAVLIFAIGMGCNKRSTPNKVKKILTEDSWKIERFTDGGVNLKDLYNADYFVFETGNGLKIPNRPESGSWFLTSEKNPAVIEINLPTTTDLSVLADDWNVVYINKTEFHLERKDGKKAENDELFFVKQF